MVGAGATAVRRRRRLPERERRSGLVWRLDENGQRWRPGGGDDSAWGQQLMCWAPRVRRSRFSIETICNFRTRYDTTVR